MLSLSSIFASMKKPGQAKEKAEEAKQMADDIQARKGPQKSTSKGTLSKRSSNFHAFPLAGKWNIMNTQQKRGFLISR